MLLVCCLICLCLRLCRFCLQLARYDTPTWHQEALPGIPARECLRITFGVTLNPEEIPQVLERNHMRQIDQEA